MDNRCSGKTALPTFTTRGDALPRILESAALEKEVGQVLALARWNY